MKATQYDHFMTHLFLLILAAPDIEMAFVLPAGRQNSGTTTTKQDGKFP